MPQGQQSPKGRLALLGLAALLAGCGGHSRAAIEVTPARSLSTQPLVIRVTGARGATLTLRSRDATGATWMSTTRLPGDGTVGARAIYRMQSAGHPGAFYIWSASTTMTFHAAVVQAGRVRASATFTRSLPGPALRKERLSRNGFVGAYAAARGSRRHTAVLLIGGSEGGLFTSFLASSLAAHGYPALAVAYFAEPGLSSTLSRIPVEYFARALRWLAAQPQVDPRRIDVLGISRGSEAAQLLGAHYPTLVHGVVAVVPSDAVNCAFPGCDGSAWTLHGRPLPYAEAVSAVHARIPDEEIRGPVLFICAGQDEVWPSCAYAHDAMSHLTHDRYRHTLVVEPLSDHGVGSLVPYEPNPASRTVSPDELGREDVWPKLLAFLAAQ